jgi:hypothetical protein
MGLPLKPKKAAAKYKTVVGALVREHIPISYRKWIVKENDPWRVPKNLKDAIWEEWALKFFTFPGDCDMEQIKKKNKRNHRDMLQEFQANIVPKV